MINLPQTTPKPYKSIVKPSQNDPQSYPQCASWDQAHRAEGRCSLSMVQVRLALPGKWKGVGQYSPSMVQGRRGEQDGSIGHQYLSYDFP